MDGLGKNPGDNVHIPSSPKANESEQKENKKAPTQSPGCGAGLKNAFSSCCSCFYNGLRSVYDSFTSKNMQKYVDLEDKDLYGNQERVRKTTSTRVRGSDNANRTNAGVTGQKNGGFFASIRRFMSKEREMDIHEVRFDANGLSSKYSSTVKLGSLNNAGRAFRGVAGKAGELGISAATGSVKGVQTIVGGMGTVAATGIRGAAYMADLSERERRSWGELFSEFSASTRGMQGSTLKGALNGAKGLGYFVGAAIVETPEAINAGVKAITPGRRAASFAAAIGGAGFGAGASFVNRVQNANFSALVPRNIR
jgi:hypothetical protein